MIKLKEHKILLFLLLLIGVYSCASIGQPDGGPYDETPPKFIGSIPKPFAVNNKNMKIEIDFDEFVKIEKASEKVIVSPPQINQPEIKASGKKIIVELQDTLKKNTTYTIDFGDAISDNNEGNPLGNFAFTFSTGSQIDTMQISGIVLNASDLEPIKGIDVGLQSDLSDSAFLKKPFDRVARTDGSGKFTIRGIAPGKYNIFALKDGNQNAIYDSKTEVIAFADSVVVPTMQKAERQDTLWKDSTTIDTIKNVQYIKYMPDNIVLKAFKAENRRQYLKKVERDKLNHFLIQFSAKADSLPKMKGLNFDEKDAFIVETNNRNDSIGYWIKDSLVYDKDTLEIQLDYFMTDSLNNLVPQTDTLYVANKLSKAQRERLQKKADEEREKELKKKEKKGEKLGPLPTPLLKMNIDAPSVMDIGKNITLSFEEPVSIIDTSKIHLQIKVDTLWNDTQYILTKDSVLPRTYQILAEWTPENEYKLTIDSLAFTGLYGLSTGKVEQNIKIKKLDEYSTLLLNIVGADPNAVVELLDASGKVIRSVKVTDKNTADFYFLNPGKKYYVRLFNDRNKNGIWDTGEYETKTQPEEVFYFPKVWEMKSNFEFNETWNINAVDVDKQKLDEIKKQKPDEIKKIQDRNKERARKLGR